MSIFRKNSKKLTDNDETIPVKVPVLEEKIIAEESDLEEENVKITPREYHSGTDSDTEIHDIPLKKKKRNLNKIIKIQSEKIETNEVNCEDHSVTRRQTILLSATLTNAVEKLAGITMTDPVFVDAAVENLQNTSGNLNEVNDDLIVPEGVVQSYVVTPPKLKMVTLSAYIAGKCQVNIKYNTL